jgi:hypothetical protein
LTEAFRDCAPTTNGAYAAAATATGLHWRTCRRGWEEGWPQWRRHMLPIKDVLAAETAAVRAKLSDLDDDERARAAYEKLRQAREDEEQAQRDAVESRKQEAQMVRLARTDATQALAAIARMIPGVHRWAQWAAEQMSGRDPKSLQEVTKVLDALSKVTERVTSAGDRIMAMERRLLGQPEQVVGLQLPDVSLEDAAEHVRAAARALRFLDVADDADAPDLGDVDAIDAEYSETSDDGYVVSDYAGETH